ncbi:metal ABC transporter solute-binding protein, Zn/Mn family [Actinokineospora spheciospongiae]|uniref:metal ABC transporter solute-binding protein, Zn/Mn family n=1 Tax=Actinokineospora spheciospongiae TaxID=909613 RepID=UPI000D715BC0|nr:zinc ABC transporter substrate-binding protein [Actinokineospora spheciospongiae]PWW65863.1 zinc/manganese transport system substrate-binding protein [Actinokineospora spheciospongiae]
MTPRSRRPLAVAVGLTAVTLASVTACGGSQDTAAPTSGAAADGKVVVVASTNVWASVAQAVGGDGVTVNAILSDPAADPHGYEAKPADATKFTDAKVVISNGGGYDDFIAGLSQGAADARKIVAFDLLGAAPADGEEVNEHVWYDFGTVRKVADTLATQLGEIAPDKKDSFTANAKTFGEGLDKLTTSAAAIGQAKPGAKVVATEPVAAYLFAAAGLADATPPAFAEAIEEETDPPAAAVADIDALVTGKQVAAVVYNAQTETPVTKQLKDKAAAVAVPVVAVTETLPADATGYLEWMTKQVDSLAGAVSGS